MFNSEIKRKSYRSSMLLLAALLFSLLQSSHQECRPEYERSKFEKTHTACLPPNDACVIEKRGLSAKEKKEILNVHNDFRSQVAKGKLSRFPPAQDMLQLVSSKNLSY